MAMTKRLWSLSALGVELSKDRRTIARIMDGVKPDGNLNGHPAWFLTTALQAAYEDEQPNVPRLAGTSPLSHFASRLDGWEEIYGDSEGRDALVCSLSEMAELIGEEPETLVVWLRAGMPYAVEGDWHTGAGFGFRPSWVFDWKLAITCLAAGDRDAAKKLRIGAR